jgi:hypothetical protein
MIQNGLYLLRPDFFHKSIMVSSNHHHNTMSSLHFTELGGGEIQQDGDAVVCKKSELILDESNSYSIVFCVVARR